jgi:hypothetical protein
MFAIPRSAPARRVRLGLEMLEGRALLSTFASIVLPVTGDVHADLTEVKADVRVLSNELASNTNLTVKADLKALNTALTTTAADLAGGKNAVHDVDALIAAKAALAKDLGKTASATVRNDLDDLGSDLKDLNRDAVRLQQDVNADLREDQGEVTTDIRALSKALAADTNADVVEDVKELNTDLKKLTVDMAAGKLVIGDLDAIAAQAKDLAADLGAKVSHRVQGDLDVLLHDVKDVTADYSAIAKDANGDLSKAQADMVKLTNELGTGAGKTVTADLKALNALLSEIGGDAVRDLIAASNGQFQLMIDAGGAITVGAQETFYDLSFNLTDLAMDLATLKV